MRSSGILMHITSLPGPYGVGTLGKEAYRFVDFLRRAGQRYWQILPVGPTGYGDSPYQTFCTFAGNPYLIDLDRLKDLGLLEQAEIDARSFGDDPGRVDYGALYENRLALLRIAFERFARDASSFESFCTEQEFWLTDYVRFMALKARYGGKSWTEWPEPLRFRREEALVQADEELAEEMDFYRFLQYAFFVQWKALRSYAHENGVRIIGDVPIYVPLDSSDVWSNPKDFQLDKERRPTCVAGVPPDYFSADGQLWGNPLYDWKRMKHDGYRWWIQRMRAAAGTFDVVRIDHFRGIESYWAVPYGEATARNGAWCKGPGMNLIRAIRRELPELDCIAEDLGFLTPEVTALVKRSGFPGMKVLEFAFDPREPSNYLPHNYDRNCICYTGTHDNETLYQWVAGLSPESDAYAREYLHIGPDDDLAQAIIHAGMDSKADLFVAQMQDYLRLGAEARMNEPGTLKVENWRWRAERAQLTDRLAEEIADLTNAAGRV